MGRELKRVPLDFDWPLNRPWKGYLNELASVSVQCQHCGGSGYSPEAEEMKNRWYGHAPFKPEDRDSEPFTPTTPEVRAFAERNIKSAPEYYGSSEPAIAQEAVRLCELFNSQWHHHLNQDDVDALVAGHRLHDLTDDFIPGKGWQPKDPPHHPTAAEVNRWSINGFGHDSINQWVVVKAECARLGVSETCAHCGGEGVLWPNHEAKQAAEDWQRTEPPTGDGWQIWETVSEGSPISPVFETAGDLARHMATTTWGADKGTSVEQWRAFIEGPCWAPSMVMEGGKLMSGVEAAR